MSATKDIKALERKDALWSWTEHKVVAMPSDDYVKRSFSKEQILNQFHLGTMLADLHERVQKLEEK